MHLQLRALLVRMLIVWVPQARESRATLALQFDLDTANGRLGGKIQDNFACQEVEVCVVGMPTVQQDCRGHGDERPKPGDRHSSDEVRV